MYKNQEFSRNDPIRKIPYGFPGLVIDSSTGELYFPEPEVTKSTVYLERSLTQMQQVLYDDELLEKSIVSPQKVIHRIYRTIGDTEKIVESGLKYDITVILPGDWGRQLPTTIGHYHLPIEGNSSKTPSPDFYQVISGNVMAILQRETEKGTEVLVLQPQAGDWVLIPGEYAHSVVNIGVQPAVFANICVRSPHLNYTPILNDRGMGVYVVRNKQKQPKVIKNWHYSQIASVRYARSNPHIPGLAEITHKESFFKLINTRVEDLAFLTIPDSYPHIFNPSPLQIIH